MVTYNLLITGLVYLSPISILPNPAFIPINPSMRCLHELTKSGYVFRNICISLFILLLFSSFSFLSKLSCGSFSYSSICSFPYLNT